MNITERMATAAAKSSNPLKAIKAYCYQCLGGSSPKRECTSSTCSLFDFRDGTNPRRKKRLIQEEQRQQMADQAAKNRSKRFASKMPLEARQESSQ